jgi:4-hydroxyproline epimerase
MQKVHVIDSHTGGEPTRLVLDGAPDLGRSPITEKLNRLKYRHDDFRQRVMSEPRGNAVLVGALLLEPHDPSCSAGVIFFNNVGYLGMCGHGTIGLVATLAYLGKVSPGPHRIETPVGIVTAHLHEDGRVSVTNVPSYRLHAGLEVNVSGHGLIKGDVAWGGNWFFLVDEAEHKQTLSLNNVEALTDFAWRVRVALPAALAQAQVQLQDAVDHIELFGSSNVANSKSFVLCPGKAYDRSPCGTGTSAKLACLVADGKLRAGETWLQESIVGSVFAGSVKVDGDKVLPTITGTAFVTGETTLIFDERDPFVNGIG